MTEELQQLLDRIRQEGVDKANAEAAAIVAKAREEADALLAEATSAAEARREAARRDAEAFTQRATESLRQAARDLRIQVEQDLNATLERLLRREVEAAAATPATLQEWIAAATAAYIAKGEKGAQLQLGGAAAKLVEQLRLEAAAAPLEVKSDAAFPDGFTLHLEEGRIEHSFTTETITAALARLLRPQLVKFLQEE